VPNFLSIGSGVLILWGLKFAYFHRNWRSPLTLFELLFRLWWSETLKYTVLWLCSIRVFVGPCIWNKLPAPRCSQENKAETRFTQLLKLRLSEAAALAECFVFRRRLEIFTYLLVSCSSLFPEHYAVNKQLRT